MTKRQEIIQHKDVGTNARVIFHLPTLQGCSYFKNVHSTSRTCRYLNLYYSAHCMLIIVEILKAVPIDFI